MSQILAHKFFLLRCPLLPVDKLITQADDISRENIDGLAVILRKIYSEPLLKEAIYLASPDFYAEFSKWVDNENFDIKESRKITLSLYKYFVRMCTRPTPYGLFAGCASGQTSESTQIVFDENNKFWKKSRLDMNYVAEMVNFIINLDEVKHQLKFYNNSSIYRLGNKYRYTEYRIHNKNRSYFLSSVGANDYIEQVLQTSKQGATINQLIAVLQSDEISYDEALTYINELISAQILVSELEPTTTGNEFFDVLIKCMLSLKGTNNLVLQLKSIKSLLNLQDTSIEKYNAIAENIRTNFTSTSKKDLVQTDLFFKTSVNQISEKAINTITKSVEKLFLLTPRSVSSDIESFSKRFYERYEEQEIPLLFALDNESGLGYGSNHGGQAENAPLVEDLAVPSRVRDGKITWGLFEKMRFEKFLEAKERKLQSIEITDIDMKPFEQNASNSKIPESLYAFGSILASSAQSVDEGDFKFQLSVLSGPSAGNLFARFSHGDEKLSAFVKQAIEQEESSQPNAIFAEVVHLPESRVGNILMRPAFRKYEIPFLGNSSVVSEYQISLDDLLISVPNGSRVVLKSKRLNKEIIPRLTSAHNYNIGIGVYRFLCDLQKDGYNSTFMWDWGMLSDQVFLPRIEYKKLILSRAKWRIKAQNYAEFSNKQVPQPTFWTQLRVDLDIPRFTVLTEGDNELLIDWQNEASLEIIYQKIKKKGIVNLQEFLSTPENCFVEDKNGKYTNEVLLPLYKKVEVNAPKSTLSTIINQTQRSFVPGREWFYIKIYAGVKSSERILTEIIKPLTEELIENGVIDKWFFIRFKDSNEHLRIRFYSENNKDFGQYILSLFNEKMESYFQNKMVYKVQIDTYDREIERYGSKSIELCEKLFYHDSVAVLNFTDMLDGGEDGEQYRWLFALKGIDMLLDDFRLSIQEKSAIIENLQTGFFKEFSGNTSLTVSLNNKYRKDSENILALLDGTNHSEDIRSAIACFEHRTALNQPVIDALLTMDVNDKATFSPKQLLPSLIHMYINRLLVAKHRLHELVIYHYLDKYYKSKIARMKSTKSLLVFEN